MALSSKEIAMEITKAVIAAWQDKVGLADVAAESAATIYTRVYRAVTEPT